MIATTKEQTLVKTYLNKSIMVFMAAWFIIAGDIIQASEVPPPSKSRWSEAREIMFQANKLLDKGEKEEGIHLLEKLAEEYQDVPHFATESQIRIAMYFQNIGDYERALSEYEEVITKFPKERVSQMHALTYMARFYEYTAYDFNKAIETHQRIINEYRPEEEVEGDEVGPFSSKEYIEQLKQKQRVYSRAQEGISKKRWNEAKEKFIQAGRLSRKGDHQSALSLRKQLIEQYRNVSFFSTKSQLDIARQFRKKKEYRKSLQEYEAVIKLFPKEKGSQVVALIHMANIHEYDLHDLAKALETFQRIVRQYSPSGEIKGDVVGANMQVERLQRKLKEMN